MAAEPISERCVLKSSCDNNDDSVSDSLSAFKEFLPESVKGSDVDVSLSLLDKSDHSFFLSTRVSQCFHPPKTLSTLIA